METVCLLPVGEVEASLFLKAAVVKGVNALMRSLVFLRGTELLVYQVVQVGKKGGVLFLGFSFGNFGFRLLLNFLQNLFGIFAEIGVKGYLCHSLWDNECLG